MIISTFEQVMREHMNYFDSNTVHMIAEATDNDQSQILIALTSKLYEMIVAKVAKIDYSSVSSSRGDITKIENYSQLVETINIIKNIVAEYRCDTTPVTVVEKAMENVQQRTAIFKRAFVIGAPVPVVLYNNICINIVAAVSYMIDTCIEYIKNPQSESFQMALDVVAYNKTMECVMFDTLKTFNEGCASGDIDAALNVAMNKSKVKREAVESLDEAGGMFDEDKYLLDYVKSCVNFMRKHPEVKGDKLVKKLDNKFTAKSLAIGATVGGTYGAAGGAVSGVVGYGASNTWKSAINTGANVASTSVALDKTDRIIYSMLKELRKLSLSSLKNIEKRYNQNHKFMKKADVDTYTSTEIESIRNAAQKIKYGAMEGTLDDEDLLIAIREEMEDTVTNAIDIAHDNPFQTDEDIDNPRMVLHDGEETNHASIEEAFDGIASIVGRGLIALCKLVIPLIRHIVYLYFFTRQRTSDYFESQAMAIEMNAYQLQYNTDIEPERRQEIYNKQMRIAEKLRKKAQRTSIDYKRSQKEAEKEIAKEQKKFTADELDINPNANDDFDAAAGSILF